MTHNDGSTEVTNSNSSDPVAFALTKFSDSTKRILGDINEFSGKLGVTPDSDCYEVLSQYSFKEYKTLETELVASGFYPELTRVLRVSYDCFAQVPYISVCTNSEADESSSAFLDDAVFRGIATGQITDPSPFVRLGHQTPTISPPRRRGTFEPDGIGAVKGNVQRPYLLWETNYRNVTLEEARRKLQRMVRGFEGNVRVGVLLGWNETEQVWVMEVYRYFDARSPDTNICIPDELDRQQELQHVRAARNNPRGNARHGVYLQNGGPYIVWPRERRVEYVSFSMMDVFDRFWNEIATTDELRMPNATFRFIVDNFDPFGIRSVWQLLALSLWLKSKSFRSPDVQGSGFGTFEIGTRFKGRSDLDQISKLPISSL